MVEVKSLPGVSLPKAYSSNLFRRALTKGSESILEGIGNRAPGSYFSTEHLGERMLSKEMSKRAAATAAASKGQAAVLIGAKKAKLGPQETVDALGDRLEHSLTQNAIKVDVGRAEELANSQQFQHEFEFIYRSEGGGVAKGSQTLTSFDHDAMLNAIKTMAQRVKTGGQARRALVEDGKVLVVRKGIGESMVRDMEGSAKLANLIYRAPLTAWKGFILGLSPRYFVNNVIGNAGMYAAATNPAEFSRGIIEATKAVRGIRAASKLEKGMETTVDSLMKKWMPDEWVNSRFGYLQHGALGVDQTAGVRLKGALKRAGHAKFYAITEQVAYRGPQRSSLMGALHTDGDFRNLYRTKVASGMERKRAYREAADSIISDPRKQAAFEKRVTDWAGQYYHLNSVEKKLTAFVPFYTWDRHALRFGKEQVLSRPVRSIVLAQLGAMGDKQANQEMGNVPDFMKGAIPVSGHGAGILGLLLGQNIRGRKKVLLTAGYNPLAAAADDADAIAALFGQGPRGAGEAIGGQLNPVISGAIAGITGQNLFSGAKAETHGLGPIGGAYEETINQLPHTKLIKQLLGKKTPTTTSKGTPTLYEKGMRQTISSLLGLNERDFSPVAAKRLYDEQHGIKKGRRRKKKDAAGAASSLKSSIKSNF
jgi:xanthosine utilization system XapX-like protein